MQVPSLRIKQTTGHRKRFRQVALGVLTLINMSACSKPTIQIAVPIQRFESQVVERFLMFTEGFVGSDAAVEAVVEVPQVKLEESSQLICLKSKIRAQINQQPENLYGGSVSVCATLDYKPETGGFHLLYLRKRTRPCAS